MSALIVPLAFMVLPILPPIIGATTGAVLDRVRRETTEPTLAVVEQAKARTAARRLSDPVPQAA